MNTDLMKIKVLFVAEKKPDFVSQQIMKRDNSDFSHVLINFDDTKIFHAIGEGVCIQNLSHYLKDHVVRHSFDVSLKVTRDYFLGYIKGSEGKEYSQSQIAAIASGNIARNGNEKMICSELVGIIITQMAHYKIEGDQDGWRPIHCFRSLKNGYPQIN